MKISEKWLREWVNPPIDTQTLVAQLSMAGLEVDNVSAVAGAFDKVVVGLVKTVEPHPDAARLSICQVDAGTDSILNIVCGASNVRPNLKVAVALIGARLPGGMEIKKAKLRGAVSEGMLCSASELGLAEDSEGIIELPAEAPLGKNLRDYMLLDDFSINLELTPNRGDCLSVAGIAREVSVLNKCPMTPVKVEPVVATDVDSKVVKIENPAYCGQYYGRVIRNIDINAKTPLWMLEKLRRSGVRAISPVVDIANYVMLELGQPLHTFDLHTIAGDIGVRLANPGETLVLLDGQTITLKDNMLIIADALGPIALAGIMGGKTTQVTPTTSAIFLESAYFPPSIIVGKARSYGLSTDASHRYERGVDPEMQQLAMERATQLLVEHTGAIPGPVTVVKDETYLPKARLVKLRPARVDRVLGTSLTEQQMFDCLQRLGMAVFTQGEAWEVRVPASRYDITIEADLIEEIARIYGYSKIHPIALVAKLKALSQSETKLSVDRIYDNLTSRGYQESISYSFVDPEIQSLIYPEGKTLDLINPISSELSQMRKGLWPGLIAAVLYNQYRQQTSIRLFEHGKRFITEHDNILQQNVIAGICAGTLHENQWNEPSRNFDFYDLKGDVESLLHMTHASNQYHFMPASHPALHPGQSACLKYKNKTIGWLGALHPNIVQELDLMPPILLFELELDDLTIATIPKFMPVSKFPSIRRDLSFTVDKSVPSEELCTYIRRNGNEILQTVTVFDMYQGPGIEEDKKSLAIALVLQHPSRTLIDAEINQFIDAILNKLKQHYNIVLRE